MLIFWKRYSSSGNVLTGWTLNLFFILRHTGGEDLGYWRASLKVKYCSSVTSILFSLQYDTRRHLVGSRSIVKNFSVFTLASTKYILLTPMLDVYPQIITARHFSLETVYAICFVYVLNILLLLLPIHTLNLDSLLHKIEFLAAYFSFAFQFVVASPLPII